MTIPLELSTQILRLYHVERWRIHTIATQLRVHRDTVRRVIAQSPEGLRQKLSPKVSMMGPYVPFIQETLTKYPTLTASRLHAMVTERGYSGGASYFRHRLAELRPRPSAEAYLRLRTLPGEQGQVDWGHFGYLQVGRSRRPLMAFVIVLSYSRRIFLHFSLNARLDSFLRGHALAFQAWGGVPRVVLCDNLKSAVIERVNDAIRFNPELLAFASHYRYEPRPVAVARGNEKGRVERSIQYIRTSFFAAREFDDIQDLNRQALAWCEAQANSRPWPQDHRITVREAFAQEQPSLMALPEHAYELAERLPVQIGKTPYARFDLNDYSIPHTHTRRTLTVLADPERVRILDGATVLASHVRSYDSAAQIEDPAHIQALRDRKRGARHHGAVDRLTQSVPAVAQLLEGAAARGHGLSAISSQLTQLLDRYGAQAMQAAVLEALANEVPHPNAVRMALERVRELRNLPPPIHNQLSERARTLDVTIRPNALETYDQLAPAVPLESVSPAPMDGHHAIDSPTAPALELPVQLPSQMPTTPTEDAS